jgi:hypothetical protein
MAVVAPPEFVADCGDGLLWPPAVVAVEVVDHERD